MSSILVTDILQELKEENKRLLNELLYAKQCLKVLIEFKINFDFYSNKFKQSLEINEWKKFEKLNEEIIGIVFKLCGNRVNTNSDYITEDVIKTEEIFNDNINDNNSINYFNNFQEIINKMSEDNERPTEIRLETNEQVLNETINSGNSLINDNNLNDINREMNNEIHFCQPIDNSSRDQSMNTINSIQETSIFNPFFDESLQKSVISYIRRNNSLFNNTLNEYLGQTSDQLVSQDVNRKEQNMRVKCDICDRSYSNEKSLSLHKSITHRKRDTNPLRKCRKDNEKTTPFKCDICHRSYSNKNVLRVHKYQYHNIRKPVPCQDDKEYFKCDLCDSKYSDIHNLKRHKRAKHDIKRRKKCPKCSKLILTDIRLKVHLNMHENNGVFRCWHIGCDKVKHSETDAISHLNIHRLNEKFEENPNEYLKYSCDWPGCDYRARTVWRVNIHKMRHYPDEVTRKFACDHDGCGKKFKTKRHLTVHLECHKTGGVQCQHCGKHYKNDICLKNHTLHSHTRERSFVCDHPGCQFQTTTAPRLKVHKFHSHSNRSIACTVEGCDKRFATERNLKSHLTSHITERNFKCPFDGCHKTFKTEKGSKIHYKQQHTENELLRCDWPGCDFLTKSRVSYRSHSNVHKTERDFLCEWPECGKGFKNRAQLRLHTRRHTNDKRYVCLWPGCQYSTTDSGNSIKHRKQVHEKNSNYYMNKK